MDLEGLSAICAGLGVAEEDENGNRIGYSKGEYCLDNVKDLLRFLRRDDLQTRDVFKQVCKWNTVSKDLIPIIEHCQDDRNLVLNAVKVLVFLTMPIEPSSSEIPQQLEFLWGLKSSITYSDIVAIIVSLLESPLENLERDALTEDDWKLMQLILTLFKNILAIQEISVQQKAVGTVSHFLSLRDRFLELLFRENVMDLIIVVTQHFGGYLRNDNLLLLEIFHYIFMGQEPELIAKIHGPGSKTDGGTEASINSLKSIMEEEEKKRFTRGHNLARHSHFVGTFTRLTMDGSKAVFKGKPTPASRDKMLKPHKVTRGAAKTMAWNHGKLPPSRDEILGLLHDFVNQFLAGGYNGLMQSLREDIRKEHPTIQKTDVVVFFQVAQFATSFQYYKVLNYKPNSDAASSEPLDDTDSDKTLFEGDICGPIAASMNESMFQLVFSNWRETFEGLKETHNFKFVSVAGSLMKNMICMLDLVLKTLPEDSKESQTARILLYKLFYDQTDQGLTQFLLHLLKSFDAHKQAKSDLEDLVEMISKILHLMENLQERGSLRVSKKSRKVRKKKAPSDKENKVEEHSSTQNEISEPITDKLQQVDDGDDDAPKEINNTNLDGNPETDTHDKDDDHKNINGESRLETDNKSSGNDSSGDEHVAATGEVDFNSSSLVSSFASNSIIQKLCWLLKFYKSNSTTTNDYIIAILGRISDDLDLSTMLYQLSLMVIFYEILDELKSRPSKEHINIVDFLTRLVRRMLKKMKKRPLLFVESLFWKTRKECHYIDSEYLVDELGHMRDEIKNWGKDSEDVDIGSSDRWTGVNIADALGDDEADVEISHELRNNKEKFMEPRPGKISKMKKRIALGPELDEKIRDLFEKYKESQDCSRLIAEEVDPDGRVSSLQVSKKLNQLGLKTTSRKRIRRLDSTNIIDGEERVGSPHGLNESEQTSLSGSKPRRKRVHAFTEDQEATIKVLYEQFKDHKRCSSMIADAMDTDDKFSAAQVSRKLKQLGLYIPRQKKSNKSDEALNFSDDETLQSLAKRKKKPLKHTEANEGGDKFSEDDSDNELLASVAMKKRPLKRSEIESEAVSDDGFGDKADKGVEFFSEDDSDSEPLASLAKKKKPLKRTEIESEAVSDDGFGDEANEGVDKFSKDDSDSEPLASIAKKKRPLKRTEIKSEAVSDDRYGNKADEGVDKFSEDDSDDEPLASVVKKRRPLKRTEIESEAVRDDGLGNEAEESVDKISEDDSDDELLASVVKKKRRLKRTEISNKAVSENVSGNEAKGIDKLYEDDSDTEPLASVSKKSSEARMSETEKTNVSSNDDDDDGNEEDLEERGVGRNENVASVDEGIPADSEAGLDDNLEDSEDEKAYSEAGSESVVNRRRMVVDFEDDD